MRRSICVCDPGTVRAGQCGTWKWLFTSATALEKGAKIKFDIQTLGRSQDWEVPAVQIKGKRNVIYGLIEGQSPITAKEVAVPDKLVPQYEFTLSKGLAAGDTFMVVIGAPPGGDPIQQGNRAQNLAQRRRPFLLFVDPKGKGQYEAPEMFAMDIRGAALRNIVINAPSLVVRNKRFDVVVRFEDEYGNLTNQAPPGTLIELSYQNLRDNLNWKLFVPETGYINLPNLYFNEPGLYHLQLRNLHTDESFVSSPIRCEHDSSHQIFWGNLHGDSERWDSLEQADSLLRQMRDDFGHGFFATSVPSDEEDASLEQWKSISHAVDEFDESERFAAFPGQQFLGTNGSEGLRLLLYSKDNKSLLRRSDTKSSTLSKIYKSHLAKELISIPLMTMGAHTGFDFKDWCEEFEPVVEIFNCWGSAESGPKEDLENLCPIESTGKKSAKIFAEGSIQKALQSGCRVGFVAGGLDDRGAFGKFASDGFRQYQSGLTAVLSKDLSRDSIFEALRERHCYATTGAKMLIGLNLAGAIMGDELSLSQKPGLEYNRHLTGFVAGTAALERVELIRNGEILKRWDIDNEEASLEFALDDTDPLEAIILKDASGKRRFAYFYLRATQKDGHVCWSSPIWINFSSSDESERTPKSSSTKGRAKKS